MDRATNSTAPADRLLCAVELSKNSWLLGIQFPDREKASVYPIKGGDSEDLMAKLVAACDLWTKVSGKKPSIILCYEAGYDAFWLARFLKARGIECLVVDSASMQVNRRSRRAKTDRIDLDKLLRALIAWCGGERHVGSVVRIPTIDGTAAGPDVIREDEKTCAARTASAIGSSPRGRHTSIASRVYCLPKAFAAST